MRRRRTPPRFGIRLICAESGTFSPGKSTGAAIRRRTAAWAVPIRVVVRAVVIGVVIGVVIRAVVIKVYHTVHHFPCDIGQLKLVEASWVVQEHHEFITDGERLGPLPDRELPAVVRVVQRHGHRVASDGNAADVSVQEPTPGLRVPQVPIHAVQILQDVFLADVEPLDVLLHL